MPRRQLLLLRPAKAVIGEPGMEDFDRPLAERGRKAAKVMGRYIAEHGLAPDLVLCSPARRTRETWEISARELPGTETRFIGSLYDFGDGSALLEAIREQGGHAGRLLLIGHNPAIQSLALALSGHGETAPRRLMLEKFPTAGLAVIGFSAASWQEIAEGAGHLDAFIRPRGLMDG